MSIYYWLITAVTPDGDPGELRGDGLIKKPMVPIHVLGETCHRPKIDFRHVFQLQAFRLSLTIGETGIQAPFSFIAHPPALLLLFQIYAVHLPGRGSVFSLCVAIKLF